MNRYQWLKYWKALINDRIKEEKKSLHKILVKNNRWAFILMDCLVALCILLNFGATTITNYLVVKETPTIQVMEANPIQAKLNNYEEHPKSSSFMSMLYRQILLWFILIMFYVSYRRNAFTELGLVVLMSFVLLYFMILGWDFFNNFGYLIGFWRYG